MSLASASRLINRVGEGVDDMVADIVVLSVRANVDEFEVLVQLRSLLLELEHIPMHELREQADPQSIRATDGTPG